MPPKQKTEAAVVAEGAAAGEYLPLPLIGKILEKGFSSNDRSGHWQRASAPQPRVTPFPVARHRSDGPHWALPTQPGQVGEVEKEDPEDKDGEQLVSKAQPLIRKKKKAIEFSKWKTEDVSKRVTSAVRDSKTEADVSFMQLERVSTEAYVSSSQLARVSNVVRGSKTEAVIAPAKGDVFASHLGKQEDRAALSDSWDYEPSLPRLSSPSLPSLREKEITGPPLPLEDISSINEFALEGMTNEQIAEAQQELAERFGPDILDMLRKRGKEKAEKKNRRHHSLEDFAPEDADPKSIIGHETVEKFEQSRNFSVPSVAEGQSSASNSSSSVIQSNLGSKFVWEERSWTDRVEAVRTYRFGLDGNLIGADPATLLPTIGGGKDSQWKIPNVNERDFLRMEGDPCLEGYTIKEAVALARSMVPAQRSAALRLLSNILKKAMLSLQDSDGDKNFCTTSTSINSVDWQAIWAYALGPEPELVLTLRISLDDSHATAVVNCARALEFLLSSSANEHHFNLCESLPSGYYAFTAPIFRKPFFQESGLIGDCFWKYNVKPTEMFPFSKVSQSQGEDTDATVKDDAFVANQDVAAGLIRMGILPRIRYLLEVERLTSAEDSLFAILTALSRHSPAAADAVMKCPRLISTIHELFVHDETLTWSARSQAIKLLKVLSIARRSNCIEFINMGTFGRSQLGLLRQALIVGQSKGIYEKSSWAELVESLQFWRVCVKYGLCISCFSDYYPALLFWIATPSARQPLEAKINIKDATLAEASFHLLETLATTLPFLHGSEDLDQSTSEVSSDSWSWKFVIPIIEVSLGWLSLDIVQSCTQTLMDLDGALESAKLNMQIFLRVIPSVLHFLSTVCDRILEEGNSGSKWLPTFVPKVVLQFIRSGILCFHGIRVKSRNFFFAKCISKVKQEVSDEDLLDVMNCLLGIVRLQKVLDRLLGSVKDEESNKACGLDESLGLHESLEVEETLRCGLTFSAKEELLQLLKNIGDDLLEKSIVCTKIGNPRRGGPAPGVGIGWGCKGGGYWSHQMLTTQVEIVLVQELTDILSSKGLLSEMEPILYSGMETWSLQVGLTMLYLSGPYHRDLLEHVFSDSLFRDSSIDFYIRKTNVLAKQWLVKLVKSKSLNQIQNHLSSLYQIVPDIRLILLQHVRSMWLSVKVKHTNKETGDNDNLTTMSGGGSKISSFLSTIPEDKAVFSFTSNRESLAVEWAGQKLPIPSLWFLSPLLSNVGLCPLGDNHDTGEVVRHGLILLFGMEALTESFPLQIPVVRKIHSLSSIFVMSDDIFLENGVNCMIGALQEKFVCELDFASKHNETLEDMDMTDQSVPKGAKRVVGHKLDFEDLVDERYLSFLDKLTNQFASVSYGDLVFSRQVGIYLIRDVSESLRLRVWKALESEHMLEFLPPLEQCCGPSTLYLYPLEDSQDLLKAYASSLASGALDRARARNSVSFSLAIFHVAEFIFSKGGGTERVLRRKAFAKDTLLQMAKRPQFKELLVELLKCKVPPDPESIPCLGEGNFRLPSANEMKWRCTVLEEACAQYSDIIDKIQQLKDS